MSGQKSDILWFICSIIEHREVVSRMRKFILPILSILAVLVAGIALFFPLQSADEQVQIELYSDPFPMVLGPMELMVSLTDGRGRPIEGADVHAVTRMIHEGSPPINDVARRYENDYYYVPIIWSMLGQSSVRINVELPDGRVFEEEFLVFVYINPPDVEFQRYRSEREIQEELMDIPENEYWIVVPAGAREITGMHMIEFVPDLINLSVSGQDTLVIRNDDFVDNAIGPFYVAAGETLRQRFNEPGVFQGTCTINQGVIRIEVGA